MLGGDGSALYPQETETGTVRGHSPKPHHVLEAEHPTFTVEVDNKHIIHCAQLGFNQLVSRQGR